MPSICGPFSPAGRCSDKLALHHQAMDVPECRVLVERFRQPLLGSSAAMHVRLYI